MQPKCEHPKVRVVAREEDADYMECMECGEVFDSEELREIAMETGPQSDAQEESGEAAEG